MNGLLVALGGGIGALTRYGCMVLFAGVTRQHAFPWVILSVNTVGSLLAGVAFALAHDRQWLTVVQQHLLVVGFLGGLTTYSTFSVDTVRLMQAGEWWLACGYVTSTTVLCFAATALGIALVRIS
ncbi:MAG TPA: CrcB family protein [Pseudomonadales bacterium]|jgi:CrcB protein|nr:CrcB family protein [Pseudomonadales bacterium]HNI36790.1 CrcB family protein [Pseudomonadales bacterium]HNL91787.1 CrcB family protein [Pseudomonadales bacterium]HNN86436.1 CrcB family protein [Pseudomonadales bacterium]